MLWIKKLKYIVTKEIEEMKKRVLLLVSFLILLISFSGCKVQKKEKTADYVISELKVTACNAADKGNTCFTRLPELGIISPEECCSELGKCCEVENEE